MLTKATPKNVDQANAVIEKWLHRFSAEKAPISVDVRSEVSWIKYGERYTHNIHPYPAKLLPQIPALFLQTDILSQVGNLVLDPFCGSSTVGVECIVTGKNYIGVDSNPLATLISKVKLTPLDTKKTANELDAVANNIPKIKKYQDHDVVNLDYWFYPHVKRQLSQLRGAIELVDNAQIRDFFDICFSSIIRRVSLCDLNVSVPVKLRPDKYPKSSVHKLKVDARLRQLKRINVSKLFLQVANENLRRIHRYTQSSDCFGTSEIKSANSSTDQFATTISKNYSESVDLIITSPPYVGSQKYIRASSLSLGWLGLAKSDELRSLESQSMGREHYRKAEYSQIDCTGIEEADLLIEKIERLSPLRAHIAANYLTELRKSLANLHAALRKGGHIILVMGNSVVCGEEFDSQLYARLIAENLGLRPVLVAHDLIRSRGLMTKRNRTSSVTPFESIIVFQK